MATTPRLNIEGLSLSRGKRAVVHDVSLSVMPGELVALVGPPGGDRALFVFYISASARRSTRQQVHG